VEAPRTLDTCGRRGKACELSRSTPLACVCGWAPRIRSERAQTGMASAGAEAGAGTEAGAGLGAGAAATAVQLVRCVRAEGPSRAPWEARTHRGLRPLLDARLVRAVDADDVADVSLLLCDPDRDCVLREGQVLFEAACRGRLAVVQMLLRDSRVDPSAADNVAIRRTRFASIARVLLADARVDASAGGDEALRAAARLGLVRVMAELLTDLRVDPRAAIPVIVVSARVRSLPHVTASVVADMTWLVARAERWRRRRPWVRSVVVAP
jgi:hypothetical protein